MKEQIEMLMAAARGYMMIAKAMGEGECKGSMRAYAEEGAKCCKMVVELEKEWQDDATVVYLMAA